MPISSPDRSLIAPRRRRLHPGAWLLALLLLSVPTLPTPPTLADLDVDLLAGMKARSIGPAGMSGRVAAIEAEVSNPDVIWVGAATGGLWKSVNAGLTWKPVFDDEPVAAIGAIAIHQASPDIVWVGTGEGNPRNSVSVGNGVYRTSDGGLTWEHMGLEATERIARILVHPSDPDTVWVGAMGREWGENEERGVFKTTDGGKSWQRVLYVDQRTGVADLVIDPGNPKKLIAAMWDFRRWPWSFRSGGVGSGLHVSVDGGESWKRLTPEDGLPEGDLGRIGLAFAPSNPQTVYALIEAKKENAIYVSRDGGFSWKRVGAHRNAGNRPFYYADLRVDPQDPDRLYSLWSLVSVSEDGGKTFEILVPFAEVHPDHHELWIHPNDPEFMINGNDGGIAISRDRGRTWDFAANLPLAQFYHIAVDMDVPYNVYGGMQDNGSWRGPSRVWENGGIRNHHWEEVGFGDGFDTRPHPEDSTIGYAMSQQGFVQRWNLRTGERKMIRPAHPEGGRLRFNWNAGIAQDPFDADSIYFGSQFVHRSTDRGETWETISGDLTTDNPEWQKQSEAGGLTPDVTGAENFVSILTIAPSPVEPGVLWVGTDDGRLHVTQDGGKSWNSVEGKLKGVPANTWVPHIAPSHFDKATAFAVFDDHRRSNWTPYVYRTDNFGKSWKNLYTPELRGYALSIVQDPVDPELLFLGTEFGLWVSVNGGKNWMPWRHGVPTVGVRDLVIHPREHDLIVGTHGRAAFVLDDIRPLRDLTEAKLSQPMTLFEIPPAQQYSVRQTGASRFPGHEEFRGTNAPYGASITLAVSDPTLPHPDKDKERERKAAERAAKAAEAKSTVDDVMAEPAEEGDENGEGDGAEDEAKKEKQQITVRIADSAGKPVRTFKRKVHQGVNRFSWDLRRDGFLRPPNQFAEPEEQDPTGPEVLPGSYRVTIRRGDQEVTGTVEVLADPRYKISMQERQARESAQLEAGALQERAAKLLHRLRDAAADIDIAMAQAARKEADWKREQRRVQGDTQDSPWKEFLEDAKKLKKSLVEAEKKIRIPETTKGIVDDSATAWDRISTAQWFLGSGWDAPSPSQLAYLADARESLGRLEQEVLKTIRPELEAFRQRVEDQGLGLLEGIP